MMILFIVDEELCKSGFSFLVCCTFLGLFQIDHLVLKDSMELYSINEDKLTL